MGKVTWRVGAGGTEGPKYFAHEFSESPTVFGACLTACLGSPWRPLGGPVLEKGPIATPCAPMQGFVQMRPRRQFFLRCLSTSVYIALIETLSKIP